MGGIKRGILMSTTDNLQDVEILADKDPGEGLPGSPRFTNRRFEKTRFTVQNGSVQDGS